MVKLDAKFYSESGIYKVKDHTRVSDAEYVVFLAQDTAFAEVLPLYRDACLRLGADGEQVAAVNAMIRRLDAWRAAHPERCKVPDAKGERLLI